MTAARWAALKGALLAGGALLVLAGLKGRLDAVSVGVAVLAAAASLLLPSRGRATPDAPAEPPQSEGVAGSDTLLWNIPDPVVLVDDGLVVRDASEAARVLLPNSKPQHPLSFALRAPEILDGIGHTLTTREPQTVTHYQRVPTERAFEVQIGPVHAKVAGDASSGALLFFRDLTAAHRLEHVRVDFVANASHELRTPLASLLGFVETLEGPARNDPAVRDCFLAIMRGQAQRTARLIDDLLSLSRIEMKAHLRPETAARGEEGDRVRGLATGADDYVTKPFSVRELLARVGALLRRARPGVVAKILTAAELELTRETRRVHRDGTEVHLGPTEFKILEFLMQSPGRVFSREQLLDAVRGHDVYIDERTVDVHIGRVRKALNGSGQRDPIRTVRGSGYSFDETFSPNLPAPP